MPQVPNDWLKDVLADEIILNAKKPEMESRNNTWTFGIRPELELTEIDLSRFIEVIRKDRETKAKQPCVFYVWNDEQSGNLCLSVTTKSKSNLPFGCKVNLVDKLHSILKASLNDSSPGFLAWEELNEIPVEESSDRPENEYILDVWAVQLNL